MTDAEAVTEDALLGGALRIRQPARGHRVGHDAILLAAATAANPGDHVVEFGAGVGAAALALAHRARPIRLTLIERDEGLAALARDNLAANAYPGLVAALDVTAGAEAFAAAGLAPGCADAVLMNPPFHDAGRHRPSPDARRKAAHLADSDTLPAWMAAARRLLRNGGTVTLIWRADGLAAVLTALRPGFGGVAVLPVYGAAEKPATRVLARAVKGSRAPLQLMPPLILNVGGRPTAEAQRVLAGEALPLAEI